MKVILLVLAAVVATGCRTPAQSTGPTPQSQATKAKIDAKVEVLTKQVADLDSRLQSIEDLLKAALGEQEPGESGDRPQPDPTAVYAVPIDGYPSAGARDAKVTIVEAYEYACSFCYRVSPTLEQLMADYPNDVKVVFAPYIVHPQVAVHPGLAACAADKQGKFMAMHGLLFEKGFAEKDLGEDKINALAKEAGLDMARFQKDLQGDECITLLKDSHATLGKLGVTGTPTFFINGRHLVGAQPIAEFKKLIDEELAKANAAIARGTRVEDYYRKAVLEAGKPSL